MLGEGRRKVLGCLSLALMGLAGCTGASADRAFRNSGFFSGQGIIGGATVDEENEISRQTVLFFQLNPVPEQQGYSIERCTGTLVAPRVVLTAAHCVPPVTGSKTIVYFDAAPKIDFSEFPSGNHANGIRFVIHPSAFDEDALVRVDLAFMLLDRDAPSDSIHARFPADPPAPEQEPAAVVAGYGRTTGGMTADREPVSLRSVEVGFLAGKTLERIKSRFRGSLIRPSQTQIDQMEALMKNVLDTRTGAPYIWLDQTRGKGGCLGDSGGPVFVKRGERLLQAGVTSFALQESPLNTCKVTLAAVNLASKREWVDGAFNRINGTTDETLFVEEEGR